MEVEVRGPWLATTQLGLQAKAGKPGYRPDGWAEVPVPGHWQQVPAFAGHVGAVLYRAAFDWPEALPTGGAARLTMGGVFSSAKVWLNGTHLGEHRGYFAPVSYDVSRTLRVGENAVMVEVACGAEPEPNARTQLIGTFGPWEGRPAGISPGGICGPVVVQSFEALAPERLTLHAVPGQPEATVTFTQELTAFREGEVTWRVRITPETFHGPAVDVEGRQAVRRGWNRVHAAVSLPEPRLWWTWDRGRPELYRFQLELEHSGGDRLTAERLFGVRKVELKGWNLYLNGERLFLRGVVYGPARFHLATVTPDDYRRDLTLMRQANLNSVRAYGHVAGDAFYAEASRQGLLIWQDMPLHGLYRRAVAEEARGQAAAMVDRLHHWPAVALWCGHADPTAAEAPAGRGLLAAASGAVAGALGEAWNRGSLASAVRDTLRAADPTRPAIAHPQEIGAELSESGRGFLGWHGGQVDEVGKLLRDRPQRARMVTGFGAQAFPGPALTEQLARGPWSRLNWEELSQRYTLQQAHLERHVPQSLADGLPRYAAASQWYQAHLHRYLIEHLRQLKYAPCAGLFAYHFADGAPAVSFALLDARREPKAAYAAVAEAMRPLTILADWPTPVLTPGARLALRVFLVNDTAQPVNGEWSWRVEQAGQALAEHRRPAEVGADALKRIGDGVDWTVPAGTASGEAELVLTLMPTGAEPVQTRYAITLLTA